MLATATYKEERINFYSPKVAISEQRCIKCGSENAFYFCQQKTGRSYCAKQLCRECVHFGTMGMDYCRQHLPAKALGSITVATVEINKPLIGEYIGSSLITNKGTHRGSLLANNFTSLDNYRSWLYTQVQLKGEVWRALVRLRDLVLAGIDVVLLCGQGDLHGDIVKKAIEWMIKEIK